MRNKLPPIICTVCGIIMLMHFFLPQKTILYSYTLDWVSNSTVIVGVFGMAIGLASLSHMHIGRITKQTPGWGYSIITLVLAIIVAFVGIIPSNVKTTYVTLPQTVEQALTSKNIDVTTETNYIKKVNHSLFGYQKNITNYTETITEPTAESQKITVNIHSEKTVPFFDLCYQYLLMPLAASTFSLLAFYIITATYRAVRAKSWESGLLLLSAIIVLLGQVPIEEIPIIGRLININAKNLIFGVLLICFLFNIMKNYINRDFVKLISNALIAGGLITLWFYVPKNIDFDYVKNLILQYPNTAAKRGIIIGIALGGLATSIKILFGIEKPYMGGRG